jgi:hypothetical protein
LKNRVILIHLGLVPGISPGMLFNRAFASAGLDRPYDSRRRAAHSGRGFPRKAWQENEI